jgi:hypothetical protein
MNIWKKKFAHACQCSRVESPCGKRAIDLLRFTKNSQTVMMQADTRLAASFDST